MTEPAVTILVPNYKTPELTRLCFRLLNKFTRPEQFRVIAVDNDSGDDSLEYLRSLDWIRLIERHDLANENGPQMHANALDIAFAEVTTEFVLVIHTDTLVTSPEWLDYLLSEIRADDHIAGVGSWKLEYVSPLKRFSKKIENVIRKLLGKSTGRKDQYLRSHCALYRTELLRKFTHGFNDGDTAGRSIHQLLEQNGYLMKFLPVEELGKYIRHLNHATGILNPSANSRKDGKASSRKRIHGELALFREILNDPSLDKKRA